MRADASVIGAEPLTDDERGPCAAGAGSRSFAIRASLGYRTTSRDEAIQDDDDGHDQQQVDEPTADMERERAEQPEYEQDYRECPDHRCPRREWCLP
jgi:hypothetical protein